MKNLVKLKLFLYKNFPNQTSVSFLDNLYEETSLAGIRELSLVKKKKNIQKEISMTKIRIESTKMRLSKKTISLLKKNQDPDSNLLIALLKKLLKTQSKLLKSQINYFNSVNEFEEILVNK